MSAVWLDQISRRGFGIGSRFRRFTKSYRDSYTPTENEFGRLQYLLMEGTGSAASTVASNIMLLEKGWQTSRIDISSSAAAAVTDWTNLNLYLIALDGQAQVSWANLDASRPPNIDLDAVVYQNGSEIVRFPMKMGNNWTTFEHTFSDAELASLTVSSSTSQVEDLELWLIGNSPDDDQKAIQVSWVQFDAASSTSPTTTTLTVTLLEDGSVARASFSPSLNYLDTTYQYIMTSSERDSVTDWTNLSYRFHADNGSGVIISYADVDLQQSTPVSNSSTWKSTGIHYNPGVYILLNPALDMSDYSTFYARASYYINDTNIDGFGWRQDWNQVENATQAVDDWSKIKGFLDNIQTLNAATGRKFKAVLDITPKSFDSSLAFPSWLRSQYGGKTFTWVDLGYAGSSIPMFWQTSEPGGAACMAAWLAFWARFGAQFNSRADEFAWVTTHETAATTPGTGGFTYEKWLAYYESLIPAMRSASSVIPFVIQMNYMGVGTNGFNRLSQVANTCIANNVFLGGPDFYIDSPLEETSYNVFRGINGALPIFHDMQWKNYDHTISTLGRTQTISDVLTYMTNGNVGNFQGWKGQGMLFLDFRGVVNGQDTRDAVKAAAASFATTFPYAI